MKQGEEYTEVLEFIYDSCLYGGESQIHEDNLCEDCSKWGYTEIVRLERFLNNVKPDFLTWH